MQPVVSFNLTLIKKIPLSNVKINVVGRLTLNKCQILKDSK